MTTAQSSSSSSSIVAGIPETRHSVVAIMHNLQYYFHAFTNNIQRSDLVLMMVRGDKATILHDSIRRTDGRWVSNTFECIRSMTDEYVNDDAHPRLPMLFLLSTCRSRATYAYGPYTGFHDIIVGAQCLMPPVNGESTVETIEAVMGALWSAAVVRNIQPDTMRKQLRQSVPRCRSAPTEAYARRICDVFLDGTPRFFLDQGTEPLVPELPSPLEERVSSVWHYVLDADTGITWAEPLGKHADTPLGVARVMHVWAHRTHSHIAHRTAHLISMARLVHAYVMALPYLTLPSDTRIVEFLVHLSQQFGDVDVRWRREMHHGCLRLVEFIAGGPPAPPKRPYWKAHEPPYDAIPCRDLPYVLIDIPATADVSTREAVERLRKEHPGIAYVPDECSPQRLFGVTTMQMEMDEAWLYPASQDFIQY